MKTYLNLLIMLLALGATISGFSNSLKSEARPIVGSSSPSRSRPIVAKTITQFNCIAKTIGQDYATVGQRADKKVILIVWTQKAARHFGEEYTPQKRCNIVTEKLNEFVRINNGTMKGLMLTNGYINDKKVVCVLRKGETSCNPENLLFTLNPDNASRPSEIVNQLLNTSRYASISTIVYETESQTYFNLENWEENGFNVRENSVTETNSPPQPNNNNEDWAL